MIIAKNRKPLFLFVFVLIFCGAFLISISPDIYLNNSLLVSEPLHSLFESIGAIAAVLMSLLLLHLHQDGERENAEYFLLSMGFLTMGILDAFHAGSTLGHGSTWFRCLASISGSVWFALVWLPRVGRYIAKIKSAPWIIVFVSISAGVLILRLRKYLPSMIQDGGFARFAVLIYVISGVLLVAAGFYFFIEFFRFSTTESYLFTLMFFLSGVPALQFSYSAFWTEDWWIWHVERCLAYIVIFYYMFRKFLQSRDELKRAKKYLEEKVTERTEELSVEVAARKRYGSERDKVIVKLQDALSQIKTLSGLLSTCASCKKIKDTKGNWIQMESYIQNHSDAKFSHGLCPDCVKELYPEMYEEVYKNTPATSIRTMR